MRISDWSSDVCSSDLIIVEREHRDGGFADREAGRGHHRWQQPFEPLAGLGQLRRNTRHIGMNIDADMMRDQPDHPLTRSEEHTSELQSLMRISYAVFCLKQKTKS